MILPIVLIASSYHQNGKSRKMNKTNVIHILFYVLGFVLMQLSVKSLYQTHFTNFNLDIDLSPPEKVINYYILIASVQCSPRNSYQLFKPWTSKYFFVLPSILENSNLRLKLQVTNSLTNKRVPHHNPHSLQLCISKYFPKNMMVTFIGVCVCAYLYYNIGIKFLILITCMKSWFRIDHFSLFPTWLINHFNFGEQWKHTWRY